GDYAFDDLLSAGAGGYTVTEGAIPPSAGSFNDGKTTAGGAGGTATAVNTLPSAISNIALGAGVQTTNYIFGELPRAGITGTVYVDRNRNDTMDATPTDGRISGVTLTLRQGTSCSAGTVLGTTTTDANGQYAFNDLSAGLDYAVCETQPSGYANGTVNPGTNGASSAANSIAVTNLPSSGSANNNFGERVGSLAGSVYQDTGAGTLANFNNGVRDAGEPGIAGVAVTLTGTDAAGGAVNRTATTDASGNYSFDDLLEAGAGGYAVTEGAIPPAAGTFLDGKTTAGGAGGTATPVDTLPSVISNIALGAGVQTTNYIFGELPSASISGVVYVDRNRNDSLDPTPTDSRISGVTLTLRDGASCSAGTVLGTTTTAADGTYSFSGIAGGGTYTICETQPTGYANGTVNPGTNGASSAANSITLTNLPTTGSTDNNFGERVGSLAGAVYMDTNNDGQKQSGEPGLAGVSVTLTGADAAGNAVNRTATTSAAGDYRFDDLLAAGAGGYTVTEQATQPTFEGKVTINGRTTAGSTGGTATAVVTLPSAISAIPLAAGVDSTAHNFGELLSVGLSGTVFADLANDGIQQLPNDLGLGGVTLNLTGTDDRGAAVTATTTTAADGSYSFTGLRPGTYTVTEPTQPAGTVNGITTAGSTGGTATAVATLPSVISGIPLLTSGAFSTGNNFAEIPNNSGVGGRVWLDLDNDG
ncbi:MAG: SdrD B-like domain-containing protein, partial [Gammaproteobacteria bacterium]